MKSVVIVGGGTAGWITACVLAAKRPALSITLIESPDVATVGVGEGSWPTLRGTLSRIGIHEADFLKACDATFKQGSRFDGWVDGSDADSYLHPFAPLPNAALSDILSTVPEGEFARAVSPQADICAAGLAPKQPNMGPYAGALNYGYHLDAGKLAELLRARAVAGLNVRHVSDHVTRIIGDMDADIEGVDTREHGRIDGDFFVDCTGQASLLLGGHYGVGLSDRSDVLFNDTALVLRREPDDRVASQTISTAHAAGWIWDIGLPTRRGTGLVYASSFMDEDRARDTLAAHIGDAHAAAQARWIDFQSATAKHSGAGKNCVGIGLSAGFLEPLEASAIVLVELSAHALADAFPVTREIMDGLSKRFNARFHDRWERTVEFLKLHYVLSKRTEPYWQAHRDPLTQPERLRDLLAFWTYQPPSPDDFPLRDEMFPAASYAYVLYGMGYQTRTDAAPDAHVQTILSNIARQTQRLTASLPTNRAVLNALTA